MKAFGINMNSSPAGKKRSAPSMLESPYSKTFIFAPHSKDMEVKEAGTFFVNFGNPQMMSIVNNTNPSIKYS